MTGDKELMLPKFVYTSGPLPSGDVAANIRSHGSWGAMDTRSLTTKGGHLMPILAKDLCPECGLMDWCWKPVRLGAMKELPLLSPRICRFCGYHEEALLCEFDRLKAKRKQPLMTTVDALRMENEGLRRDRDCLRELVVKSHAL